MLWFYLVGLIWTCEFIFACQQLAIAGAVAYWYFKVSVILLKCHKIGHSLMSYPQKPTDTPVICAISKLVKYHLGSVAKGSFIITIFKIPRLILTYLYAK
jgi:solute carrier family 44 (choline transporter-like protein), member 1